jgi:hypothetical protein
MAIFWVIRAVSKKSAKRVISKGFRCTKLYFDNEVFTVVLWLSTGYLAKFAEPIPMQIEGPCEIMSIFLPS